ncbi:MAG: class I SAM-dependent methyltransferase [Patescibacteria group bacterium]|nr:class I SAM-dependent methyltransferase [Patescibacteria group bacterium]
MVYLVVELFFLSLGLFWTMVVFISNFMSAPWVPLTTAKVRRMLEIAEVKPNEVVMDLGSGDARVLIEAAKKFQARGVGIELNPFLAWLSRLDLWIRGLGGRVKIKRGNMYKADFGQADVITAYLMPKAMVRLEEKIEKEVKPGARVVCCAFPLLRRSAVRKERVGAGCFYLYKF